MAYTQLIYLSDLVKGQESQLGAILESAVRHNSEDHITGMLLYAEGNFLQVLEGRKEDVHATYARICKDPRHHNVMELTEEEVPERQFGSWSMGYRQLAAQDIGKFPALAPFFQFGFNAPKLKASPGVALEMLELFSKGML